MINVALDGPAGSGKSTVAKILSQKLNILYLDTGAMYRACGLKCYSLGFDTLNEEQVNSFIDGVNLKIDYVDGSQVTILDGEDVSLEIRKPYVSMLASNISKHKKVRLKMVEMQREIAQSISCVLDGRDIGTYVLPNAKNKFFITATPEIRAKRRFDELTAKGEKVEFNSLLEEIKLRDKNDSEREFAPLRQASDAILIDTSYMTILEVTDKIISCLKEN